MKAKTSIIPVERIERRILTLRGHKVLLDESLAQLYGVSPGAINQAVRRNPDRFPEDFMFQLSWEEMKALRSQSVILKRGRHRKYRPFAFTEQGVAMLSSVLRSKRAIRVNIAIVRTFVRLRRLLASHRELARRLDEMELRYDAQFKIVFDALRELIAPAPPRIGFHARP